MEEEILRVIRYFAIFSYPPTFEEIHAYLGKKITISQLQEDLNYMVTKKVLLVQSLWLNHENVLCYTLVQKSYFFQVRVQRDLIAQQKIESVLGYIRLIKWLPQLKLIAFSGSLSMSNTSEEDDIDLFIITATNRIWTVRFILLCIAFVTKRRGRFNLNKICLNLFFDENGLEIPDSKKNEYIAHELFQMRSIVNKQMTFEKLLMNNSWAFAFFPNSPIKKTYRIPHTAKLWWGSKIFDLSEKIFKWVQVRHLTRKKIYGVITDHQVWLIKEDFEKKIPFKLRRV